MESTMLNRLLGELRTQVNDLSTAIQLLSPLVSEHGGEADAGCLANANKSVYRLIRTICHLELCENPDHVFCPKAVDAVGLCRDVSREAEYAAEKLEVDFDWTADKAGELAMLDEQLVKLAVFNMLSNAFQAAGKGGQVSLRAAAAAGRLTVTVSDSGEGLKPPRQEGVSLVETGKGMGLGLDAARRVASLHGGALMLESAEGSGTRSVLSLPLRKPTRGEMVERNRLEVDVLGGHAPLLVEFSPLLGRESFLHVDEE